MKNSSARSYYHSKASQARSTAGHLWHQYKSAERAGNTSSANTYHEMAKQKYSEMAANMAKEKNV